MRQAYSRTACMNPPEKPPVGFDFDDEDLEAATKELGPMCDKQRKRSFDWYYTLGTVVREHYLRVQQERERRGCSMYGEHFYTRLAEELDRPDISDFLLSDCARLVQNVSKDEYAELNQHPQISPTHARMLGRLWDKKDRDKLKARIITEQLTTKQLNDAIGELYGPQRSPGGGRKPMVPKNVQAALTHLARQAEKFCSLNENWFGKQFDLPSQIAELTSDKFNAKLEAQLKDALQQCESLAATADADTAQLRTLLSEVQRRITAQAEANARRDAEEHARREAEENELTEQQRPTRAERTAEQPDSPNHPRANRDRRIGRELHAL